MSEYEPVIGLEVHVQLQTHSKLFCGCGVKFGAEPNSLTCPVCLGMPGSLPVLNRTALEYAILTALALDGKVAAETKWDRKHYWYPDLPKNYQISQYDKPYCVGGRVEIETEDGDKTIRLTRIHLEEDAGKSIHDGGSGVTCVDLNRTGTPLMEIVSEPDLAGPAEAGAYLRALKHAIEYLGVSDCNMQEGSLRCDANVSVRPTGDARLGVKVEIKNMNSISGVEAALAYEIRRQTEALARGAEIVQETRLWDPDRGVTETMRTKEGESDYRYFPEPDLPLFSISQEWIEQLRARLPEPPRARRERLKKDYELNDYDARVLTAEKPLADYFEAVVTGGADARTAKNWVSQDVLSRRNELGVTIDAFPVRPEQLGEMIALIGKGTIDQSTARDVVFPAMVETGAGAQQIVDERGLAMVSDADEILKVTRQVLEENPKPLEDAKKNPKAANRYIGMIRKAMGGKADVKVVRQALRDVAKEMADVDLPV